MHTLYPSIKTYTTHRFRVDEIHTLYVEECGYPQGLPVLIVHDGPGSGCDAFHRRFFDPQVFRIILFDQRSSGRSEPFGELKQNTTSHLVGDMEAIRKHLNIPQWILFGFGWGSALSLLYTQKYPKHVLHCLLSSVFLARQQDIDWSYKQGTNLVFPDHWLEFTDSFSDSEKDNLISAYRDRLGDCDEITRMATAKSWALWQAHCSSLQPHSHIVDYFSDPHLALSLALLETHYLSNHCFIEENQIIDNMDKIANIPGSIVHGRYDIICPLHAAWTLQQHWPAARLSIVRDAGHSIKEPGLIDAIIHESKKIAKQHGASA